MTLSRSRDYEQRQKPLLHKKRPNCKNIEIELHSAQLIEEEEFALAKSKTNEQARLEAMHLDEEAAIELAKAITIEEELNQSAGPVHYKPPHILDLPSASPKERVQGYLDLQDLFIPPCDVFKTEDLQQKYHSEQEAETKVKLEPDYKLEVPFPSKINQNASILNSPHPSSTSHGPLH